MILSESLETSITALKNAFRLQNPFLLFSIKLEVLALRLMHVQPEMSSFGSCATNDANGARRLFLKFYISRCYFTYLQIKRGKDAEDAIFEGNV